MLESIRVSHSKLEQWKRCRFAYNMSYVQKWESRDKAFPLTLGSMVHEFVEHYYNGLIEGTGDALERHMDYVRDKASNLETTDEVQALSQAADLVKRYISEYAIYEDAGFIPVATEKHYVVELETPKGRPFEFELYFDLLMLHEQSNRLWLFDHKTHKSRPMTDLKVAMDPQLPAYALVLREKLGVDIFGLVYNLFNTYDYKKPAATDKLFDRKKTYRTPEELDNITAEIGKIVDDIEDSKGNHYRSLGSDACSWCPFQDPCLMDLKGVDITTMLHENFQRKKGRPDSVEKEDSRVLERFV